MALGLVEQRRSIAILRFVERQARRLDRRQYPGAPGRFARLTIGVPQCRPQNCRRNRDQLPLWRGGANTKMARSRPRICQAFVQG
jgi:hypothetical protein